MPPKIVSHMVIFFVIVADGLLLQVLRGLSHIPFPLFKILGSWANFVIDESFRARFKG